MSPHTHEVEWMLWSQREEGVRDECGMKSGRRMWLRQDPHRSDSADRRGGGEVLLETVGRESSSGTREGARACLETADRSAVGGPEQKRQGSPVGLALIRKRCPKWSRSMACRIEYQVGPGGCVGSW